MSAAARLRAYQADIEAVLQSLPYPWAKSLAGFVLARLQSNPNRVQGVARARAIRTSQIDNAIDMACGPLDLGNRFVLGIIRRRLELRPENYGIRKCPSDARIRKRIKALRAERKEVANRSTEMRVA